MSAHANTGTVLDRILEARRAEVDHRKRVLPETALKYGVKAATPLRDFSAALRRDGLNVLAELKPASPSRGVARAIRTGGAGAVLGSRGRLCAFRPHRRRILSRLAKKSPRCPQVHSDPCSSQGFYL